MNSELKELLQSVIKEALQPIQDELKTVNERLTKMETGTSHLEIGQQQIIQAVLETNETVKRIELKQERYEHIQELLSLRSIEQEATLKRIK